MRCSAVPFPRAARPAVASGVTESHRGRGLPVLAGVILLLLGAAGAAAAQEAEASEPPRAARELPRGTVLAPADVAVEGGDPQAAAEVVGWVTRRVVREGEPLRPPTISAPEVIRSGEPVQAVLRHGALELRVRGTAMNAAAAGERVRVRVDATRRFEGVAVGNGLVRLDAN